MSSNIEIISRLTTGGSHGGPLPGVISALPRGAVALARVAATSGLPGTRALAVATLAGWLITEALGAGMLSSWIASGGLRQRHGQPGQVSALVIFGHAGLAFAGFTVWISFLVMRSVVLAWLAIGLLALAIGLGVSTVTVWTPFPAHRSGASAEPHAGPFADAAGAGADEHGAGSRRTDEQRARDGPGDYGTSGEEAALAAGQARGGDVLGGPVIDETLDRALSDQALTSRLIDDLVASAHAAAVPAPRRPKWNLAPLIPAAHGVMALVTVLLAMLAAVAAAAA